MTINNYRQLSITIKTVMRGTNSHDATVSGRVPLISSHPLIRSIAYVDSVDQGQRTDSDTENNGSVRFGSVRFCSDAAALTAQAAEPPRASYRARCDVCGGMSGSGDGGAPS